MEEKEDKEIYFTPNKERNQMIEDGDKTAKQLQELHRYQEIEARHRKSGDKKRADRMQKEIENLSNLIYR